jgi:hypothetical protein
MSSRFFVSAHLVQKVARRRGILCDNDFSMTAAECLDMREGRIDVFNDLCNGDQTLVSCVMMQQNRKDNVLP